MASGGGYMDNRFISWQRTRSIKSKTKYWSNVARHQRSSDDNEVGESSWANPDVLAAPEPDEAIEEVRKRVQKLLVIARQILTEQQYKVFFFITDRGLTERAIAKLLGVTHQRVHAIWKTARQKLQVAYDKRTA